MPQMEQSAHLVSHENKKNTHAQIHTKSRKKKNKHELSHEIKPSRLKIDILREKCVCVSVLEQNHSASY